MDELVARLTAAAGIDAATAQAAVKAILVFLEKEAPSDAVGQLTAAIPGADAALVEGKAEAEDSEGAGGFGGFGGGGLMAAYQALTAVGLDGGQVQVVTRELLAHAREKAGEDVVGRIVGAVPGLDAFV